MLDDEDLQTQAADYLDEDAQPLDRRANAELRENRSIDEGLGYIKGILADGIVVPQEVHSLSHWLAANIEDRFAWPFADLIRRLHFVLDDGVVTQEECDELKDWFYLLTSVDRDTGSPVRFYQRTSTSMPVARNPSTALPLTVPAPSLTFQGQVYVFTGKFFFGTRQECQKAVYLRGGECGNSVTKKTTVLVIGELGSADWIHTAYGRKIEAALTHADEGRLVIVSEEHWRSHIHKEG